ncbi:MAG: hypothetical protein WDW38_010682 [Sanguina aurantia]
MGNVLAQPAKLQPDLLSEIPNVVLKDTLGGGRFMKTLLCVHDEGGLVVVKVTLKRSDTPSMEPFKQQLAFIRSSLAGVRCCHVWPYQAFVETGTSGILMRQHIAANLYERLSTRPFLTAIEKRWMLFQLLHGLAQCQARGVCHGDLKAENVLVTSWGWLFLTDFAPYKPTYLPADNPAEFSYYFDTGGRRRCYIAPERFYTTAGALGEARPGGSLQPEMDTFSLGCVIAELFLDGRTFMELSTLLSYTRREHDPGVTLAGIDPHVRSLVMHMIQLDPGARWTAARYLERFSPLLFPPYFDSHLHTFFDTLLPLGTDARVEATRAAYPALHAAIAAAPPTTAVAGAPTQALPATGHPPPVSAGARVATATRTRQSGGARLLAPVGPFARSLDPWRAVKVGGDAAASPAARPAASPAASPRCQPPLQAPAGHTTTSHCGCVVNTKGMRVPVLSCAFRLELLCSLVRFRFLQHLFELLLGPLSQGSLCAVTGRTAVVPPHITDGQDHSTRAAAATPAQAATLQEDTTGSPNMQAPPNVANLRDPARTGAGGSGPAGTGNGNSLLDDVDALLADAAALSLRG